MWLKETSLLDGEKIYLARMASFPYPSILNLFKAEREELKYNFLTKSKRIELNWVMLLNVKKSNWLFTMND